jgi:molybdopterin synthase catalytic subunit
VTTNAAAVEFDMGIDPGSPAPVTSVRLARIEYHPLDITRHVEAVSGASAGATVTFTGQVRDHDGGRGVRGLEYSAHPVAETVLLTLANQVAAAHDGACAIAVSHRTGRLDIGDVALCAVVAAAHRELAFTACQELVETVKANLPIWKLQTFEDGSGEWVGCA